MYQKIKMFFLWEMQMVHEKLKNDTLKQTGV